MHEYYSYVVHYFLSVLIGGFWCIGFWVSSRGETEVSPSGRSKDVYSMILYPIFKLISGYEVERVYFTEITLFEFLNENRHKFGGVNLSWDSRKSHGVNFVLTKRDCEAWSSVWKELENEHFIKMSISENLDMKIWKEYNRFWWFSKPIISCYKCYASVHGTAVFLATTYLATHTGFIKSNLSILIPMWIIYVFSLVFFNVILEKLIRE